MKKVFILLFVLFSSVLLFNFIKTDHVLTKEVTLKKDWLHTDLKDVFNKQYSYSFDTSFFIESALNHEIKEFRFVLGLENNKPVIICRAITNKNEMLASYAISERVEVSIPNLITSMNPYDTFDAHEIVSENISRHLLTSKQTIQYLNNWKLTSNNLKTLNDAVSYNGQRIRHFSIASEAINYLVNQSNIQHIDIILGQNNHNKMTTIIMGKDHNLNLLLPNKQHFALDFTSPCPTACDPIDPKIIH